MAGEAVAFAAFKRELLTIELLSRGNPGAQHSDCDERAAGNRACQLAIHCALPIRTVSRGTCSAAFFAVQSACKAKSRPGDGIELSTAQPRKKLLRRSPIGEQAFCFTL